MDLYKALRRNSIALLVTLVVVALVTLASAWAYAHGLLRQICWAPLLIGGFVYAGIGARVLWITYK